jgi:hypothetical protein
MFDRDFVIEVFLISALLVGPDRRLLPGIRSTSASAPLRRSAPAATAGCASFQSAGALGRRGL